MAVSVSMRVTGLASLQRAFELVEKRATEALQRGVAEAGRVVLADMKANAPGDLPEVRAALDVKVIAYRKSGRSVAVAVAGPRIDADKRDRMLTTFAEFGRHGMKARAFIRPALDRMRGRFRGILAAIIAGQLRGR